MAADASHVVFKTSMFGRAAAGWFARNARTAFRATVEGFKIDALTVRDAFAP